MREGQRDSLRLNEHEQHTSNHSAQDKHVEFQFLKTKESRVCRARTLVATVNNELPTCDPSIPYGVVPRVVGSRLFTLVV